MPFFVDSGHTFASDATSGSLACGACSGGGGCEGEGLLLLLLLFLLFLLLMIGHNALHLLSQHAVLQVEVCHRTLQRRIRGCQCCQVLRQPLNLHAKRGAKETSMCAFVLVVAHAIALSLVCVWAGG